MPNTNNGLTTFVLDYIFHRCIKVQHKPIKESKKGFKFKGARNRVCPGLAHRTVRCATGQCPVHQGHTISNSLLSGFSSASPL
jgi:hypothetical protein